MEDRPSFGVPTGDSPLFGVPVGDRLSFARAVEDKPSLAEATEDKALSRISASFSWLRHWAVAEAVWGARFCSQV